MISSLMSWILGIESKDCALARDKSCASDFSLSRDTKEAILDPIVVWTSCGVHSLD